MIGNVSFTIEADPDDKKELFKMFSEKGVKIRRFRMDTPDAIEWIFFVANVLRGLKELYGFLILKKEKKVEINIRHNEKIISVNSKNAEYLKVYIDELTNKE